VKFVQREFAGRSLFQRPLQLVNFSLLAVNAPLKTD
jgi:hypothetical protein